jgi:hypothetical protein
MVSEFFQGIVRWEVERNGTKRTLPYFYQDCLSLTAAYTASTAEVRKLIPYPDIHPLELIPGRCVVIFGAFESRATDVEPFDEVTISFLVTHPHRQVFLIPLLGAMITEVFRTYTWKLPVSTEFCRSGGVDLFDAPKYIADIKFQEAAGWVQCSWSEDRSEVLNLKGRVLPTKRGKLMRYISFGFNYGNRLMTNVLVNPLETAQAWDKNAFELTMGKNHPVCKTLSSIKLSRYPLLYQYTPRYEQILFPARNIMDV